MRRELRRTDDETAARRAVLNRFGDPKRIAYRLWFDAMKESIMSQRISLVTNVILAAACVTICDGTSTSDAWTYYGASTEWMSEPVGGSAGGLTAVWLTIEV